MLDPTSIHDQRYVLQFADIYCLEYFLGSIDVHIYIYVALLPFISIVLWSSICQPQFLVGPGPTHKAAIGPKPLFSIRQGQ